MWLEKFSMASGEKVGVRRADFLLIIRVRRCKIFKVFISLFMQMPVKSYRSSGCFSRCLIPAAPELCKILLLDINEHSRMYSFLDKLS